MDLLLDRIDRADAADVAVEHVEVVVVADLHHLVADAEGPAPAYHGIARGVEERLKLGVDIRHAEEPPLHGRQHLDVVHRIKPELVGDVLPDEGLERRGDLLGLFLSMKKKSAFEPSGGSSGMSPSLTRWALTTMRLSAPWRKMCRKRTTSATPDWMMSPRTLTGADRGELVDVADEHELGSAVAAP